MKKILSVLILFAMLFSFYACGEKETNKTKEKEETKVENVQAKIDEKFRGTYYGGDYTITVSENSVKIVSSSGKTLEYTFYTDSEGFYFLEGTTKIYCTFGDGTFTYGNVTYTIKKDETQPNEKTPTVVSDEKANIDESNQGEYVNGNVTITITSSQITISEGATTNTYDVYTDSKGEYYYEGSEKVYFSIEGNTFTSSKGTFKKYEETIVTGDISEALRQINNYLGINNFRAPNGGAREAIYDNDSESTMVGFGVLNATESFSDYKEYVNGVLTSLDFKYESLTQSYTKSNDDAMYMVSVSYQENTIVFLLVIMKNIEIVTDLEGFLENFKKYTGIDLTFPSNVINAYLPDFDKTDDYIAIDCLLGLDTDDNPTKDDFMTLASALNNVFNPLGFTMSELSEYSYETVMELSYSWNKGGAVITLELYTSTGSSILTFDYYENLNSYYTNTWPTDEINTFTGLSIPEYTGTYEGLETYKSTGEEYTYLEVRFYNASQEEFQAWFKSLENLGFELISESYYLLVANGKKVIVDYDLYSNGVYIDFEVSDFTESPWPKSFIAEMLGEDAANIVPAVTSTSPLSFSTYSVNGEASILVNGVITNELFDSYIDALVKAGFVKENLYGQYTYAFDNHDQVLITPYYQTYDNTILIQIENLEFEGIAYILPENFVAEILGFTFAKIGESYGYYYSYGSSASVKYYLYNEDTKDWTYANGIVYGETVGNNSHVMWTNLGTYEEPIYSQNVDIATVYNYLEGTDGLAYYYYKQMKEADEVVKDSTKNETIAGKACEYCYYELSYYTINSKVEIWIEPDTNMIYKVVSTLYYDSTTQTSTAFEIKSINENVKSFKEAGFTNCIMPGFDSTKQTADDHLLGEVIEKVATCGADGEKYQRCTLCNEKIVLESTPKTGLHTPYSSGSEVYYFYDDNGHHSKYCTVCEQYYDLEDCKFGDWVLEYDATCSSEGYKYRVCTVCNYRESEYIPKDETKHKYLTEYSSRTTFQAPTTSSDGSLTLECLNCNDSKVVITLPKLTEENYTIGVYYDYFTDCNYVFYQIDSAALIKEITSKINYTATLETYELNRLFNYSLEGNYEGDTLIYGYVGDELEDPLASVLESNRGDYYSYYGDSLVTVSDNTITSSDEVLSLYEDVDGIYYKGQYGKVYIRFDEGSFYFENEEYIKRSRYEVSDEAIGEYVLEDSDQKITVSKSSFTITINGKEETFELYSDKENLIFFYYEDERCEFEINEDSISNHFGYFVREDEDEPVTPPLEDTNASVLESNRGDYYGFNSGALVTVSENTLTSGNRVLSLYEDEDGIYYKDEEEKFYIEFDEGSFYFEDEEYVKRSRYEASDETLGEYVLEDGELTITVSKSSFSITIDGKEETFELYSDKENLIFFYYEDERCEFEINEDSISNHFGYFVRENEDEPVTPPQDDPVIPSLEDTNANVLESDRGDYYGYNSGALITISENTLTSGNRVLSLYEDEDGIYYRDEDDKLYIEFDEGSFYFEDEEYIKRSRYEVSDDAMGEYVLEDNEVTIIVSKSSFSITIEEEETFELYSDKETLIFFYYEGERYEFEILDDSIYVWFGYFVRENEEEIVEDDGEEEIVEDDEEEIVEDEDEEGIIVNEEIVSIISEGE